MATGTITDKINNVVALLIDQCYCETPSEIKGRLPGAAGGSECSIGGCHCHHCDAAVVTNQIAIRSASRGPHFTAGAISIKAAAPGRSLAPAGSRLEPRS
jgi:hypothetical protein